MEGNGTGATAMLVGTPEDVGGRPDAATVTLAREEIEEALASDEPLELILTVGRVRALRRTCGSRGSAPTSRRCSPARTPVGSPSRSTALSSTGRSSTLTSRGTASGKW